MTGSSADTARLPTHQGPPLSLELGRFEESSETYLLLLQSAEQAWPLLQLDFPTVSGQLLESYMT